MSYDTGTAERARRLLSGRVTWRKEDAGGLPFLINRNRRCGQSHRDRAHRALAASDVTKPAGHAGTPAQCAAAA
jgi:hypothetical protein